MQAFKEQMEKESQRIQQTLVFVHHNFIASAPEDHSGEPLTSVTARLPAKKDKIERPSSKK